MSIPATYNQNINQDGLNVLITDRTVSIQFDLDEYNLLLTTNTETSALEGLEILNKSMFDEKMEEQKS